jgi:ribosomal protein L22
VSDEPDRKDDEAAAKPRRRRRRAQDGEDRPKRRAGRRRAADEKAAAKPEAEAPKARPRRAAEDGDTPPVVRARARYVRSSARKARLVSEHIAGRSVEDARAILSFTPRGVARDWSKLLESAVANAEHNHELVSEDLRVREAYADEGPTLRRFRPRAMGRATRIRKRTAHLTIALTPDLRRPAAESRKQKTGRKGSPRSS